MSGRDHDQAPLAIKDINNRANINDEESLLPKKQGIDWVFVWEEVK